MACSPIFGTHVIRASQVLHDRELHGCQNGAVIFYGLWLSHQTFQVPKMEDTMYVIENPPQKIRLTKVSIPAFFGYLKPFSDSCTCTRRCLKKKTHHDGTSQVGRFDDYVRISLDQPLGDVKIS